MSGDKKRSEKEEAEELARERRRSAKWITIGGAAATVVGAGVLGWAGCQADQVGEHTAAQKREAENNLLAAIKADLESRAALLKQYDSALYIGERPAKKDVIAPPLVVPEVPKRKNEALPPLRKNEGKKPLVEHKPPQEGDVIVSDVDLAEQLTDFILSQRAYQQRDMLAVPGIRGWDKADRQMYEDPDLHPSTLIKYAVQRLDDHIKDAKPEGFENTGQKVKAYFDKTNKRLTPLDEAKLGLEMASIVLRLRQSPEGVTDEKDIELRDMIHRHCEELERHLGPPKQWVR